MDKCKVTVVVPIYNVESYLNRCVESIVNQTYKNLEILLIDDGSPDNCPQMCDEWAEKDSRIKVIHKQNEGLGMARNTGIDNATGEYICFIDSDDYMNENLVQKSMNMITENSCDFVVYGFCDVTENEQFLCNYIPSPSKQIFTGEDIKNLFVKHTFASEYYNNENWTLRLSAWNCIYSMRVIKSINFKFVSEREIISEDIYSLLTLYPHFKKVGIVSEMLYYHRVNSQSITHKFRKDRIAQLDNLYVKLIELCDDLNYDEETKCLMSNPYLSGIIGALKMIVDEKSLSEKEKKSLYNSTLNSSIFKKAVNKVDLKSEKFSRRILITLFKLRFKSLSYFLIKYRQGKKKRI